MRVLVLGGTGFIGSHVVDELIRSNFFVRILSRGSDPWRAPNRQIEYIKGDFTDRATVSAALEGIDTVCHLISTTVPSTSNDNPRRDIETNLVGTLTLIEAMLEKKIRRIVYASSGGTVYGIPQILPVPETAPLMPISSYGVVKVAIENYLRMFAHSHDLEPLIIRPSNPYGTRQRGNGIQGVIPVFAQKILNGEEISIWGDGTVTRDFIHVTDLATLFRLAIESNISGVYNAGSGVGTSLNEIISLISRMTSCLAQTRYRPARNFDVPSIILDTIHTRETFHWELRVNLEQGIADLCKIMSICSDRSENPE